MGRSDHFRNHQSALPSVVHHDICTCNYVQNHTLGRQSMSRLRNALVVTAVCAIFMAVFAHVWAEGGKRMARAATPVIAAKAAVNSPAADKSPAGILRTLFGRKARVAYGGASSTSAATVATDKSAYLPGSHVVASGSGWAPSVGVQLTFTELSTTAPQGALHVPVSITVLTDGAGNFASNADPNADFVTDVTHDATVTMQVTAAGQD